ncbi:hypothetical protein D3C83_181320 [compost metagenome]
MEHASAFAIGSVHASGPCRSLPGVLHSLFDFPHVVVGHAREDMRIGLRDWSLLLNDNKGLL